MSGYVSSLQSYSPRTSLLLLLRAEGRRIGRHAIIAMEIKEEAEAVLPSKV